MLRPKGVSKHASSSPCAACAAISVSDRAGSPRRCNAADASQNTARARPAGGSGNAADCSAAGLSVWWAYCNDQALISQAWRAGDSPMRAIIATASRNSMEGRLLWDMRKDGGKDERWRMEERLGKGRMVKGAGRSGWLDDGLHDIFQCCFERWLHVRLLTYVFMMWKIL